VQTTELIYTDADNEIDYGFNNLFERKKFQLDLSDTEIDTVTEVEQNVYEIGSKWIKHNFGKYANEIEKYKQAEIDFKRRLTDKNHNFSALPLIIHRTWQVNKETIKFDNVTELKSVDRSIRANKSAMAYINVELTKVNNEVNDVLDTTKYYHDNEFIKACIKIKIDRSNQFILNNCCTMFKGYINDFNKRKRTILIHRTNDKNEDIFKNMLMENRFSRSYQRKIQKRMNWLIWKYGNKKAVMLRLSINPKLYNSDKIKMWMDIKYQVNRFFANIRWKLKTIDKEMPPYILCIEAHKGQAKNNWIGKGNPHIHIVFLNASRLMDWKVIKKMWGIGGIYINRVGGSKIRHPISYITKYITKTFTTTNNNNLLTQSLVWLFGRRSFSTSRYLIKPLKSKSEHVWTSCFMFVSLNDTEAAFITWILGFTKFVLLKDCDNPISYLYRICIDNQ